MSKVIVSRRQQLHEGEGASDYTVMEDAFGTIGRHVYSDTSHSSATEYIVDFRFSDGSGYLIKVTVESKMVYPEDKTY